MFGRDARVLDLSRATSSEIGAALDRIGMTWSYDEDGDVRFRTRSRQPPWTGPAFYEIDPSSTNFRMRGHFLEGRRVPQGSGKFSWEVSPGEGHRPTAIVQKVVTVYFTAGPGYVRLQVHAAIATQVRARPVHIQIIPSRGQVAKIEQHHSGFAGVEETGPDGTQQLWMSSVVKGKRVGDSQFLDLIRSLSSVGLEMFDGPFTGWMNVNAI